MARRTHYRFRLASGFALFVAALLLLSACGGGRSALPTPTPTPTPSPSPSPIPPAVGAPGPLDLGERDQAAAPDVVEGLDVGYGQEVVVLTNAARERNGLSALSVDANLALAGEGYAKVMADNDWFDHVGPDGSTVDSRAEAAGYDHWLLLAENLATGRGLFSPAEVVDGWMNSPGHRANILNGDLKEIGVGCYFKPGRPPRLWCAQEFGTQRPPTPTPSPTSTPAPSPTPAPTFTPTPTPTPTP